MSFKIKDSYAVFTLQDGSKEKQVADEEAIGLLNLAIKRQGWKKEDLKAHMDKRTRQFIEALPMPIAKSEVYINGELFLEIEPQQRKFGFFA